MRKQMIVSALLVLSVTGTALATPISLGGFSASANVETFGSVPTGGFITGPLTLNGVTYTSADLLMPQAGSFLFANIQATGDFHTMNTHPLGQLNIDFGTSVTRAGLLLSSGDVLSWNVSALDASMNVLESAIFSQPSNSNAVFAGFENLAGIRSLQISLITPNPNGWFTFFDDVRYEGTVSVPEPGTFGLLCAGLIGAALKRRRSKI